MHVALQTGRLDVTTAAASARNREVARRKREQLAAVHMSRASENCILNVDDRFRLRYFDARPRRSTPQRTFDVRDSAPDCRHSSADLAARERRCSFSCGTDQDEHLACRCATRNRRREPLRVVRCEIEPLPRLGLSAHHRVLKVAPPSDAQ